MAPKSWLPTPREAKFRVAWPEASSVTMLRLAPSKKVRVPVGVPAAAGIALTVTVTVMACPITEGLTEEARLIEDEALLTVWVSVALLLELKLPSPL